MPPKTKAKRGFAHETSKKKGKLGSTRKQAAPYMPPSDTKRLITDEDEEPSLKAVMDAGESEPQDGSI